MKILALVSDAHGGFGGISQFNRDALEAMAAIDAVAEIIVLPRLAQGPMGRLPDKLHYEMSGLASKRAYLRAAVRTAKQAGRVNLIFCGHINLLPVAALVRTLTRAPIVLAIHGIDAWTRPNALLAGLARHAPAAILSVSAITRDRMKSWCAVPDDRFHIVPNAIRLKDYGPGPKRPDLVERYHLRDKVILMTVGRMASEERYKGFDEVLDAMPELLKDHPELAYVLVGDGLDRPRLEKKAAALGLTGSVVFTGKVADEEKADIFKLADLYVMPSRGEGFGIVILEALASGVPVVCSKCDGTREAVLDGEMGLLVDPDDRSSLIEGIARGLRQPRGVPEKLGYFSYEKFQERMKALIVQTLRAA